MKPFSSSSTGAPAPAQTQQETRYYDCGCKATGTTPLPKDCPEHLFPHMYPSQGDVPLDVRRECSEASINKQINYYWLLNLWRRGRDVGGPARTPEPADKRSLAEIIVESLTTKAADTPICLVHENMTNVRTTKAGTMVTLGLPTHVFSPDDAIWFTGELGRPENRRPKFVGYVVFVPMEIANFQEGPTE